MTVGRSSAGANSGICQCVEELQEVDAVKEQCRCNPTEQRDVLEALGDYKCDSGMSVENVLEVVKNVRVRACVEDDGALRY